MLRNYIKVAIRNMIRNKSFTAINVLGLSLSMAVSLVLIMLVADQMSYDRYNTNFDSVYRIAYDNLNDDGMFSMMATCPPLLGTTLKDEYPGLKTVARLRGGFGNHWIGVDNDINIPIGGFFADPEVLEVFQYELEYGNPATALNEPRSVVLTPEARNKLFTIENPVGEVIKVGELGDFKVTGVLKDTPKKSHIKFEALASASTLKSLVADSLIRSDFNTWDDRWSAWTYIVLDKETDPSQIEGYIQQIADKQYKDDEEFNLAFFLQGLDEINPGPLMGNQIGPGMPVFIVYFLAGLCFLIMVSAGFNYANLSIARSLKRAREVGIRKVSGAYRSQIFGQFISEAVILSLISLLVAFLFLQLLEPAFHNLNFSRLLHLGLSYDYRVIAFCVFFATLVGVVAGFFPAMLLSALKPISVLKSLSGLKLFGRTGWRKALIVIQFSLSLFLIVSVKIASNQLSMMTSADYGFNPKGIINIKIGDTSYDNLKTELQQYGSFTSVTGASFTPSTGRVRGTDFFAETDTVPINLNHFAVDRGYIENMSLELLAGTDFPEGVSADNEQFIIINETCVERFGFGNPHDALGKSLMDEDSTVTQVIGVIRDYNHEPLVSQIDPMALRYIPSQISQIQVKYEGEREQAAAIIEASWAKVNPDKQITYSDMSDEISSFYDFMFGDLVSITSTITILAITIACLGLLGMAIYTAETREKEVSIRKVLGASEKSLVMLLSGGYFKLLLIAAILSLPLTYLFNQAWLELIAYRVGVTPGVILYGVGILIGIGAITVVSQTLRAAFTNPADKLRGE